MKRIRAVLFGLIVGCSTSRPASVPTHAPEPARAPVASKIRVGTARADLTPPPGVSTFGHGPDSHVADGYWSRLYCRVFVIQPEDGQALAIVPCDLAAMSVVVRDGVAEDEQVSKVVHPTRLMLTATHTHAGPAHYFESPAYAGVLSTRLPGYDPKMKDFLVGRIANAIVEAGAKLRPAALSWAHDEVWGLTRNRSLVPYRANRRHPSRTPPAAGYDGKPLREGEIEIDPGLDVLFIDEVDEATRTNVVGPIGLLAFFAMHPTVLPASNRLLGGDIDAVASRALESEMRRDWARSAVCAGALAKTERCALADPLAGIVNGNEGDMSPIWSTGTVPEATRIGRDFADQIYRTRAKKEPALSAPAIGARYLEVSLPKAPLFHGGTLCTGEFGQGSVHGGPDHTTTLDMVFPSPVSDVAPKRHDCQAPKHPLFGTFQGLLIGPAAEAFPTDVSFSLVRIDNRWISFVPAELTVHAGDSVRERVRRVVCDGAATCNEHFVLAGLSNAYIQYVTTWDEYQYQYYEGGSTLYGPRSTEYVGDRLEVLARSLRQLEPRPASIPEGKPVVDEFRSKEFEFGPERDRLAAPDDGDALEDVEGRGEMRLCALSRGDAPVLCARWKDGAPGRVPLADGKIPWLSLSQYPDGAPVKACGWRLPSAANDGVCDPGDALDDHGIDFEVRAARRRGDGYEWIALFHPSAAEWGSLPRDLPVQIRAAGGKAGDVVSAAFRVSVPPCECTPAVARQCLGGESE